MTIELINFRILFHAFRLEAGENDFSWKKTLKQYRLFSERARQRRQLRQLSDHLLQDVGITRAEALQEANKPCWVE